MFSFAFLRNCTVFDKKKNNVFLEPIIVEVFPIFVSQNLIINRI